MEFGQGTPVTFETPGGKSGKASLMPRPEEPPRSVHGATQSVDENAGTTPHPWSDDSKEPGSKEEDLPEADYDCSNPPSPISSQDPAERAEAVHQEMRKAWEDNCDPAWGEYDANTLGALSKILFLKKRIESAGSQIAWLLDDQMSSVASQEQTAKTILEVLEQRRVFLRDKNITDMRHVLTPQERGEIASKVRGLYDDSPEQQKLRERDAADQTEVLEKARLADAGGASQPTSKGRGKGQKGKAKRGPRLDSVTQYVKKRQRSRWCRHLQRRYGDKAIWEMLAFTGVFDPEQLRGLLKSKDPTDEEASGPPKEDQRRLRTRKTEARCAFNEAERLAQARARARESGASQPADLDFSLAQLDLLKKWDSGELRRNRNDAIKALGHGRLENRKGQALEIGGSTGGASKRLIDHYVPPDWRKFLSEEQEE